LILKFTLTTEQKQKQNKQNRKREATEQKKEITKGALPNDLPLI